MSEAPVWVYDTMSRSMKPVIPVREGQLGVYTCGPTVYDRAHVGNWRTFVFEDVAVRWLRWRYRDRARVIHVMNLTDVEDKIVAHAAEAGVSIAAFTAPHIRDFFQDRDTLGVAPADHYPRATDPEVIADMITMISKLLDDGIAYRGADGSIYFSIDRWNDSVWWARYGKLNHINRDRLQLDADNRMAGKGIAKIDEYGIEHPQDFALWKAPEPGERALWDAPFGAGRPGWHLECSAMSLRYLGAQFDIHFGGTDNAFPHHENEIAQSEAFTGVHPVVQIWMHADHLVLPTPAEDSTATPPPGALDDTAIADGVKMSKSRNNSITIPDLVAAGHRPSAIRWLLATGARYRHRLAFDADALRGSANAVERWDAFCRAAESVAPTGTDGPLLGIVDDARLAFEKAMDADLNLPLATGELFSRMPTILAGLRSGQVGPATADALRALVETVETVVAVRPLLARERRALESERAALVDRAQLDQLVAERTAARKAREFGRADVLRKQIAELGYEVRDTAGGPQLVPIAPQPEMGVA